jgi:hypothetical protein
MCKSLNREMIGDNSTFLVLMPNELPNWLLFRPLEGEKYSEMIWLTGLLPAGILRGPSNSQAFPQDGRVGATRIG